MMVVCTLCVYYLRERINLMATTKVFQNGNSQAIRIPSEMRTDRKEFIIRKIGDGFIIYPVNDPWFPVKQVIGTFPDDFMNDREQPSLSDLPEREMF